jgi:benzaldehyde dehydrogenase (NAD)
MNHPSSIAAMASAAHPGAPTWEARIFSPDWRASEGGHAAVTEPATGERIGTIGVANAADVDRAVGIANRANTAWAAMPFDQRADILRRAAALLTERAANFNGWNVRECGSIGPKAEWELNATREQLLMCAALPMQPVGEIYPSTMPGRVNHVQRVPLGTVAVITPWNFPLLLAMRSVAPALALGNTVILKPDLHAAVTGGALMAELFADAGLPEGVFQVLPGGPEAGEALVRAQGVALVSFTGSTAVGRRIGETCGRLLKKCNLELGGNNVLMVLADADLDAAASNGAWGAFLHQGQICMQAGRHLVHRSVANAYAEKLRARAEALVVGDPHRGPVHLGPLINQRQHARVKELVQDTVAAGARLLTGGAGEGLFFRPTVLTDVAPHMRVYQEEVFGPVAPITVFDSVEEAIALANGSDYGLAAAIHTALPHVGQQIAQRLHTGMVHINDQTVNNEFHVPFGGMGTSGNGGRFGGPANVHEFTQTQWVSVMPQGIQYPF